MERSLRCGFCGQALGCYGHCGFGVVMLTDVWKGCWYTEDAWDGREGGKARREGFVGGGMRRLDISIRRSQ